MKTKLVVIGAGGRVGRRIVALAHEDGAFELAAAVDATGHPDLGKDCGSLAGVGVLGVALSDTCDTDAQCVIDFSLPEATGKTLNYCLDRQVSLVLGTTGISDAQKQTLKTLSQKVPVVYATNMSVGMNVLFATVGKIAQLLGPQFDIEIVEQHHRFKKDAPSGSALSLAESLCEGAGQAYPDCLVHGRQGNDALREQGTIGMHAVRAGDITGVHTVTYGALGETITVQHTAHSRDTFVRGALRAALWLRDKAPGLYSMRDVLGIKLSACALCTSPYMDDGCYTMDKPEKVNRNVIRKANIGDSHNDFAFWQAQPVEYRLETLETIREEYNRWKYGSQQGFQRVYSVVRKTKRAAGRHQDLADLENLE